MQEAGRTYAVLAGLAVHVAWRPPRACVHGRGRAPEVIGCLGASAAQALAASCCCGRDWPHPPVLWAGKSSEKRRWCAESKLCIDIYPMRVLDRVHKAKANKQKSSLEPVLCSTNHTAAARCCCNIGLPVSWCMIMHDKICKAWHLLCTGEMRSGGPH